MNRIINKLWISFKQEADVWFFYGFLLTFTLSIRKVLFYYPVAGEFNEYGGIYLYLSDIFLFFAIVAQVINIILKHNFNKLSIKKALSPLYPQLLALLAFILWVSLSIIWANNKPLAIFQTIKIVELFSLAIYITYRIVPRGTIANSGDTKNIPRGTFLKRSIEVIMAVALFQALIGIAQFILQYSVGLFWLKESLISPNISGVAKVVFNGHKVIRAYGLFPHPNILGGFLVFSMILTLLYIKMFYSPRFPETDSRCEASACLANCSTWNNWNEKILKIVPRGTLITSILAIQILATILTFSKSAVLGLFIGGFYWFTIVPRGTFKSAARNKEIGFNECKMFHVEQSEAGDIRKCSTWNIFIKKNAKLISLAALCVLLLIYILKPDFNSFFANSINDRLLYLNVSRGTILGHPFVGLGIGQYVLHLNTLKNLVDWQYQPVHNVFLLIWAELGIVGLGLFIIFLWSLLKNIPRLFRNNKMFHVEHSIMINYFKAILIAFLTISLFDHYFWDIQQGQIMLWLVLGMIAGLELKAER